MLSALCPDCSTTIGINNNPEIGQTVLCPKCQGEYRLVWLYPLTLDFGSGEVRPNLQVVQPSEIGVGNSGNN
jgi:lysine biosynthesis protein LysW